MSDFELHVIQASFAFSQFRGFVNFQQIVSFAEVYCAGNLEVWGELHIFFDDFCIAQWMQEGVDSPQQQQLPEQAQHQQRESRAAASY
jgi:hypothetical protein